MGYRVLNGKVYQVGSFQQDIKPKVQGQESKIKGNTFQNIFNKEIDKQCNLTISNHAAQRLKDRNIELDENDMKTINEGINKANEKGSKDSLIIYKNMALVTSIKNRTIITAVDKESSKGNVFTNIDSVVLL
ncbi:MULTISPECIES: TIGR02530 family flagellar biosynthesis protein [Clostridium]|uniref:Flagellar biosynthesis protein n=1 Tax=Clostridium brassicae TaxID=2999072 RepID=A0ABT4DBD3_9CLOT|nr:MULTISPECIES: TIGR02530 family flagellar biosynthesis protein [Clostridium]MCY6959605.1 flagellar biosynthesis protein [Clostridium brassicae]WMJ81339.1 TIGR02530 family flagellar biosynthesis protein [Clostridium sp. MB40-C1]